MIKVPLTTISKYERKRLFKNWNQLEFSVTIYLKRIWPREKLIAHFEDEDWNKYLSKIKWTISDKLKPIQFICPPEMVLSAGKKWNLFITPKYPLFTKKYINGQKQD